MQEPRQYYAGLAVDGDKTGKSFSTKPKKTNPWWQVDLGAPMPIYKILIYDRQSGRRLLPMKILFSNDGKNFKQIKKIEQRKRTTVWTIILNGETTRYIRLMSNKKTTMSFAEVEVYSSVLK